MKSNGEEMREIGLLTVVHDEHEGLLTVGPSECAHGSYARSGGSVPRVSPVHAALVLSHTIYKFDWMVMCSIRIPTIILIQ